MKPPVAASFIQTADPNYPAAPAAADGEVDPLDAFMAAEITPEAGG